MFDGEAKVADLAAAAEAVSPGSAHPFATMLTLIQGGECALAQAAETLQPVAAGNLSDAEQNLGEIRLRSPVPRQIRACIAFEDHLLNAHKVRYRRLADTAPDPEAVWNQFVEEGAIALNPVWYERALYYMTNRFSVIGPDEDIRCPKHSGRIDYELEFGIFIGKEGRDISLDQAEDHTFGYSIFNDISAREI